MSTIAVVGKRTIVIILYFALGPHPSARQRSLIARAAVLSQSATNEAIISVYNLNNYTKTFVVLLDTWLASGSRTPDPGMRVVY